MAEHYNQNSSSKFISTDNKGFGITFQNGFTISVQWGTDNYCEKKHLGADLNEEMKTPSWRSKTAEIAVFDKDGKIVSVGERDDVIGWLIPNEVAKAIEIVSGYQGQTMTGMTGEKYIKEMFKKYSIK